VLKGSSIPKSCPDHILQVRNKNSDKVIDGILIEDILFTSPSGAAAFVKL
jgi:hypothetical protein